MAPLAPLPGTVGVPLADAPARGALTLSLLLLLLLGSGSCPKACAGPRLRFAAQPVAYPGSPASCSPTPPASVSLSDELNVFAAVIGSPSLQVPLHQIETPVQFAVIKTILTAIWGAVAKFHATANPVADFPVPRQSPALHTATNRNIALLYAVLDTLRRLLPAAVPAASNLLAAFSLDPQLPCPSVGTNLQPGPACVGRYAAAAVLAGLPGDGLDYDGSARNAFNKQPFADYTDYVPINTPHKLNDIHRWQPLLETNGLGYFFGQEHITPQAGLGTPFALTAQDILSASVPPPYKGRNKSLIYYKAQTDQVLAASRALTDYQKMMAEYFDDKLTSLGPSVLVFGSQFGWDLVTALAYDFNLACLYDAMLLSWKEKRVHDAMRPIGAVRFLYYDKNVTAYAGAGQGARTIQGKDWLSYLRTMPHSEYPSGTSCICTVFAEYLELFFGTKNVTFPYSFGAGCSRKEPNITPSSPISGAFKTTTDLLETCGLSRNWAGVHFMSSIAAGKQLCTGVASKCVAKVRQLYPQAGQSLSGN